MNTSLRRRIDLLERQTVGAEDAVVEIGGFVGTASQVRRIL